MLQQHQHHSLRGPTPAATCGARVWRGAPRCVRRRHVARANPSSNSSNSSTDSSSSSSTNNTDTEPPKQQQQQQQQQQQRPSLFSLPQQRELDADKRRVMEDELRDPSNFLGYLAPRPLRLVFFGFSAASCVVATLISAASLIQQSSNLPGAEDLLPGPQNLLINLAGAVLFGGLFVVDSAGAEARVQQRREIRQAQIRSGDREVFVNEQGETMSRLKEVNDDWILRRLEKWGRRENMPFLGPQKAAILQQLLVQQQPRLAVEVGSMAGYSAIVIAQVLSPDGQLVSIEKDLSWWLVAKRFMWQASQGQKNKARDVPLGRKVDLWLGNAISKLPQVSAAKRGRQIDLLLLDGLPKETLQYLKAAEPYLAPGAMVVADNAGVFAEGGLRDYLAYVRSSSSYSSRFVPATFEWRDDVPDGLEVSIYQPTGLSSSSGRGAAVAAGDSVKQRQQQWGSSLRPAS